MVETFGSPMEKAIDLKLLTADIQFTSPETLTHEPKPETAGQYQSLRLESQVLLNPK